MKNEIAFIGVGNMGNPMADNLIKAGKKVRVYDVSNEMIEKAKEKKFDIANNINDLFSNSPTTVITMLPEGKHSKEIYLGDIAVNYTIINKRSKNTNFCHEFDKMWVHGYLHLLGHNHKKKKNFIKMKKLENLILNYFNK